MTTIYKIADLFSYLLPKVGVVLKPRVIQFPVNDICNAGCQMCHIWKNKLGYQILPEELDGILQNDLFSKVKVVGINGGEPTLRKDIGKIVECLYRNLPDLQQISLITNGLVYKSVMRGIDQIAEVAEKNNGKFNIMVSLDGVGDLHDAVRGRKGNFDNAMRVVGELKNRGFNSDLQFGCTVIKENVYGLHDLHDFAQEQDVYIKYRMGIPHQRLYTDELNEPFELTIEEKFHFCNFLQGVLTNYEKSDKQRYFYKSLINQVLYKAPRKAGCDWQFRGVTITSDSKLLYCAVKSPEIGNLLEEDPNSCYKKHKSELRKIIANDCDNCLHDYVGPLPFPEYLGSQLRLLGKSALAKSGTKVSSVVNNGIGSIAYGFRLKKFKNIGTSFFSDQSISVKDKNNILICGWYGTETIGDLAILVGVIQQIRKSVPEANIYVASLNTTISEISRRQVPELENTSIIDLYEDRFNISAFQLLVFGGGPIMALLNLAEMNQLSNAAKKANVPFLLAGCGVGPLGQTHFNDSIRNIINNASYRIYRDKQSKIVADSLNVLTAEDFVAEDPAFSWATSQLDSIPVDSQETADSRIILGLRDWPYSEYARDLGPTVAERIKKNFEESLMDALEQLSESRKIKIYPVSMCTNYIGGDDRWYYRELFRRRPKLRPFVERDLLTYPLTPSQCLHYFRIADVAITMRYHALVFALSCNTPTLAIDYTVGRGKVAALAKRTGISSVSLDDVNTEFLLANISAQLAKKKPVNNYDLVHDLKFDSIFDSVLRRSLALK